VTADVLAALRERAASNRFWRQLGVSVDAAGEGWVRLRVAVRDDLRNDVGAPVHGGVLSALVDMAVGSALATTRTNAAAGVDQTTLDLNVSFLGAARGDTLLAEGRLLRRGRTIVFGEARITDGEGALLAVGRATYMVLAGR
jgi:uncharacterized protein (TIGR00369 family)